MSTHAEHLNSIHEVRGESLPTYEAMSGALVWPDEVRPETPMEVLFRLRPLFAHRTSLMVGADSPRFPELWSVGQELFPRWIGFLPERRQPAAAWLVVHRRGEAQLRACLRRAERSDPSQQRDR